MKAVIDAAGRGDLAFLERYFEEKDPDPDDATGWGCTLLLHAAIEGRCDTIRFLIGRGASLDAVDGPRARVVSFSGRRPRPTPRGAGGGWAPLHGAAGNGRQRRPSVT